MVCSFMPNKSYDVMLVWLCYLSAHFDSKCMHVESILTNIGLRVKINRTKSTPEFDMNTHTNAIFKMTYNELRLTTIISQLPKHHTSRKKLVVDRHKNMRRVYNRKVPLVYCTIVTSVSGT